MQVEKRSIDFIPETERHGKPGSLFYIWFGANMNITTIASGVLPVVMGLNLFWSALAIIVGSLLGAISWPPTRPRTEAGPHKGPCPR
ncbi:hypothetical protein BOO89_00005 [Stutzerimonas stutzeri]|nr:hypothetical protein BOO89_00005 [Stutzerimonas stutzeri]